MDRRDKELSVYKCDQCGLGFEYEAALTKHTIENHATLRLYSCEYCSEAYASTTDLHEHMTHHMDRFNSGINAPTEVSNVSQLCLACPEENCNHTFNDSQSYYSHILYQHRRIYQDDPQFIEFLSTLDPDSLTFEKLESEVTSSGAEGAKFSCKLCGRKVNKYLLYISIWLDGLAEVLYGG